MSARAASVVVVVLAGALAVWLLFDRQAARDDEAPVEAPATASSPGPALRGVTGGPDVHGAADAHEESDAADDRDNDQGEPGAATLAPATTGRGFFVSGTVSGPADTVLSEGTQLFVSGGDNARGDDIDEGAGVPLPADGAYTIDVTKLNPDTRTIRLRCDHPMFMPQIVSVDLGQFEPDSNDPGRAVAALHVTLHPAWTFTGQVTKADGTMPRRGADVAVFPRALSRGKHDPIESIETDNQGRFRLRVPAPGQYVIVASTYEGTQPAMRGVEARADTVQVEIEPIAVRPAAEITGRITIGGKRHPRFATIFADPSGHDGPVVELGYVDIALDVAAGTCWRTGEQAVVAQDGSFTFRDLSDGLYDLRYWRSRGPDRFGGKIRFDPVKAPGNVSIEVPGAVLRVRVEEGDDNLEGIPVEVEIAGRVEDNETEWNGIAWIVPGDEPIVLRVRHGGKVLERHVGPFAEGSDHEEQFRVAPASATLTVRVAGDDEDPIRLLGVYLRHEDGNTELRDARRDADGTFHVGRLQPGRYEIEFTPGREYFIASGYWLQQTKKDVLLPVRGKARVAVRAERGGRLRLDALDTKGVRQRLRCQIETARGEAVDVDFDEDWSHLDGTKTTEVRRPLPPGSYVARVTFAGDDGPTERRFHIEAGKTTEVIFRQR